jgi:hypothetical protein
MSCLIVYKNEKYGQNEAGKGRKVIPMEGFAFGQNDNFVIPDVLRNLKKESAQVKKTIGSPSLKRSDSGLILFINYQIFLRAAIAGKPR